MSGNGFEGREDFTRDNYAALDFKRWLVATNPKSGYKYAGAVKDWRTEVPAELGAALPQTQSAAGVAGAAWGRWSEGHKKCKKSEGDGALKGAHRRAGGVGDRLFQPRMDTDGRRSRGPLAGARGYGTGDLLGGVRSSVRTICY